MAADEKIEEQYSMCECDLIRAVYINLSNSLGRYVSQTHTFWATTSPRPTGVATAKILGLTDMALSIINTLSPHSRSRRRWSTRAQPSGRIDKLRSYGNIGRPAFVARLSVFDVPIKFSGTAHKTLEVGLTLNTLPVRCAASLSLTHAYWCSLSIRGRCFV